VIGEDPHLDGLMLTDVRVRLAQPVVITPEWSAGGDAGFGSFGAELLLDWNLLTKDGQKIPLATQHLYDVSVVIDVFTDTDGRVSALLDGGKQGLVWSWAGLVELDDLHFDIRAAK
jgi:hypothetical protein